MIKLIELHEIASRIVWNVGKCRTCQRFAYEAILFAKEIEDPLFEKIECERLVLYKKCEDRLKQRYSRIINQINDAEL